MKNAAVLRTWSFDSASDVDIARGPILVPLFVIRPVEAFFFFNYEGFSPSLKGRVFPALISYMPQILYTELLLVNTKVIC